MALILHDLSFCLVQDILHSELVYLALVALATYPSYMFRLISQFLMWVLFWFKTFATITLHLKCLKVLKVLKLCKVCNVFHMIIS